ncbi:4780_t:CDS:2 [Diversispora eburnea]|uniref:4780_t:CDS:1 n=1 Tax=Diversispora eburnea TaxID=1213867 RepID=A0A9N9C4N7_9GLOM|nr:4780_t:CDS:2 [Diversispora eburnea]
MSKLTKIKLWILFSILYVVIATICINPVKAQDNPKCPSCAANQRCVFTLRTCHQCPQAICEDNDKLQPTDLTQNNKNNDNKLLPGIIGGVVGGIILIAIGCGYFWYRRINRGKRGMKLKEMTSVDSENVIPIAYIPPTTRYSYSSGGTSPLGSPLPKNYSLIDLDEDTTGTILHATKSTPVTTAAATATLVTATRVKPSLVHSKDSSTSSINTPLNTPPLNTPPLNTPPLNTPLTNKSLKNMPSVSSLSDKIITGSDNKVNELIPRIDIERPSGELSHSINQQKASPQESPSSPKQQQQLSQLSPLSLSSPNSPPSPSQHLNSMDPIEGRQSFGLFGSDEVTISPPQLQRESVMSSTSTNGRSTMFSDEGDGEIMIFWGGNDDNNNSNIPNLPDTSSIKITPPPPNDDPNVENDENGNSPDHLNEETTEKKDKI